MEGLSAQGKRIKKHSPLDHRRTIDRNKGNYIS